MVDEGQQGLVKALTRKQPKGMKDTEWQDLEMSAASIIRMCLDDEVMYHVMDEESPTSIWLKLESRYMSKSLTNKLLLNKKLYGLKMAEGSALDQHINVFNQIISDMNRVDVKFEDEDMTLILLNSLPKSYDNLVTTLMWGKETPELKEIIGALLSFNQKKKASDGSSQGEGLMANGNKENGRNKS